LAEINDFILLSYPLPREKKFISDDSSYRISVEFLVQKYIIAEKYKFPGPLKLVANVVPGQFVFYPRIQKIAHSIVDDFYAIYMEE